MPPNRAWALPTLAATTAAVAALWVLTGTAAVSPLPIRAWVGSIDATAVADDTFYMAGGVLPVIEDPGPVQLRDRATGDVIPAIAPLPFAFVYNLLSDPGGGVYLFADFIRLARLGPDGQLDPGFQPSVHGVPIATGGRRLVVARPSPSPGLQIVDRDTGATLGGTIAAGSVLSWTAPGDGTVVAIVGSDLVRVDIASGSVLWSEAVLGPSTRRTALAASGPYTFLAVDHDLYRVDRETGARTRVLRVFPACSEGCSTGIEWLVLNGNRLMITGDFFMTPAQNFLVIDADSGAFVRTSYPQGAWRIQRAYAGGDRVYITGSNDRPLGALDAATFELLDWNPGAGMGPSDLVVAGPYLITAGNGAGRVVSRTGSAAVRLTDGAPTAWQPDIDFIPAEMVAGGGKVFVAGYRCPTPSCFPPVFEPRLAQYDAATGQRLAGWAPVTDARISAMALSGSRLFVGGGFTTVDGAPRSCLASFDVSGATPRLEAWAPEVSCSATLFEPGITAILPSPAGIFVSGRFTQAAGQARRYLALLDSATGALNPWNLITDPATYPTVPVSLAIQGSLLVVGGPAVAGRAPAVFDIDQQQPLAAGPDNTSRPGTSAAIVDTEIALMTGESLDLLTGRLIATRLPRDLTTHLDVLVARSGIVQGLRYYPRLDLPDSPQNLRASVSGFEVRLSWSPPATGTPLGYALEAAAAPDFAAAVSIDAGSGLSFSTVAPAGRYYVRVRARGTGGLGRPSNVVVVAPGPAGCVEPPAPPTGPTSVVSGLAFTLSWSPPVSGGPVANYEVRAGFDPANLTLASFLLPAMPSFAASGPPGVYYWAVRAMNACGASALTAPVMVTLRTLQPPTNLRATVGPDRTVTLTWDPPAEEPLPSGYQVEAGSAPGRGDLATLVVSAPTLTAANVPRGVYYVHVHSMLGSTVSGPTNSIVVTVP
jgi:hypothetical protein